MSMGGYGFRNVSSKREQKKDAYIIPSIYTFNIENLTPYHCF